MTHGLNTDEKRLSLGPLLHEEVTKEIIGGAFEVYNVLGYGFLEKVYRKALQVELGQKGLRAEIECKVKVIYKSIIVGDYDADLFVENVVLVELKVAANYNSADEAQLLNQPKATGNKVGLLINFSRTKVEFKRLVF
ncbi:MAG: GxxExxY protein [Limisphaerales bacterium]